jgi:hypothetical protein
VQDQVESRWQEELRLNCASGQLRLNRGQPVLALSELRAYLDPMRSAATFIAAARRRCKVVYMQQPEGYEVPGRESQVCLLLRAIYGTK